VRPSSGATPALAPPVAAALQPAPPKHDGAAQPSAIPPAASTIITAAAIDVAAVKRAVEMVRNRKQSDANEVRKNISDPAAKKLVEWVILRSDDAGADFARYTAFIAANPAWPSIVTLRRKAEATAWQERPDASRVQAFFAQWQPLSAKGRLALARALIAKGDRKGGEALVREAWRNDSLSQDVESRVLDEFGTFLTRADHKARMDRRLYEKDDTAAGVRAAQRLGGHEPAIAKARIAMLTKGGNKATLDAVPAAARDDIGYKFARIQMLRRSNHVADAVVLIKTIPNPIDDSHDLDEWWVERRVLARELLDHGDPKDAYLVVRDATPPTRDIYRAEHQFMAGWIALRFLHDPTTAYAHFKKISEGIDNPIGLARGAYWMGRAAEAMHRTQEARNHYREAARYPTAYYGQIARAKAGLGELVLNPFPALSGEQRTKATQTDVVRGVELLYAVEARDLAWAMLADLGDKSTDTPVLTLLAELTAKYRDARGMLLLGKLALARGYALDHAAFPTLGVPDYKPIGPPVEPALVYSIVRQESWFNPKTVSSASAYGLMQVTPPAGRYIAKKFNATFDQKRLLSDMVYNVQFGAAELGDLIRDYRGSYIMTFAAYNAGRGRLKEWIGRFGDPRDPKVDPIDWVERIPFSETRNYVQRVLENVQVYRIRFGGSPRLLIEADLRRGAAAN
jgi:soluble lytic murein transglycosylase